MSYDGGNDVAVVNDALYRILKKFEQGAEAYEIPERFWKRIGFGKQYNGFTCVIRFYNMDYSTIDDCPRDIEDVFSLIRDYLWSKIQESDEEYDERFFREMLRYLEEHEDQINEEYQYIKWEYIYPSEVGNGYEAFEYKDGKFEYHNEGKIHFSDESAEQALEELGKRNNRHELMARKKKTSLQAKIAIDELNPNSDMIHIEWDGIWIDLKKQNAEGKALINGRALEDYAFVSLRESSYYFIDSSKITISPELDQYNDGTFAYTSLKDESIFNLRPLPDTLRVIWSYIAHYGAVNKCSTFDYSIYQRLKAEREESGWSRLPTNDPEFLEAKKAAASYLSMEKAVIIFFDFINSITTMNAASIEKCIKLMPKRKDGLFIKNRVVPSSELGLKLIDHEFDIKPIIAYEFKSLSNTEFASRLLLPVGVYYPEDKKPEVYKLIKWIIEDSNTTVKPDNNNYGNDFVVKYNILKKYKGNSEIVVIPEGIEEIGQRAFAEDWPNFSPNNTIKRIELPDSVVRLDDCAFQYCRALESIRFSKNLVELGTASISDCDRLFVLDLSDTKIEDLGCYNFRFCHNLTTIILPNTLKTIRDFSNDIELEKLIIPKSVESIDTFAFSNGIRNLYFEGTEAIKLGFIKYLVEKGPLTVYCRKDCSLWDELFKIHKKLKNAFNLVAYLEDN